MNGIIDFHTHAFPDELADRVIKFLEDEGDVKAHLNGKISALLSSMDKSGVEKSVICNIATKAPQFDSILNWCRQVRSERIIPFPSFHPYDPEFKECIHQIKEEGFKGVKFHPYYQDFTINEDKLMPVYEELCEAGLIVVMHTGFDFAFPLIKIADPEKILDIVERFPTLKFVTTHLGAWRQWDEVERILLGKPIYMEISFSLECRDTDAVNNIISNHPAEYILFGTDSPWTDQYNAISLFRGLNLGAEKEELILRENAIKLLNSVSL